MKLTSTKRFTVRTALVTGTTLATIVGAQALVALDRLPAAEDLQDQPVVLVTKPAESPDFPAMVIPTSKPSTTSVVAAAPNIVILRHASESVSITSAVASQPINMQPPNPVQVAPPQPIIQPPSPVQVAPQTTIIQQASSAPAPSQPAAAPTTRSSR